MLDEQYCLYIIVLLLQSSLYYFIQATNYVYTNFLSVEYADFPDKLHSINRYNHGLANTLRKTATAIVICKLLNTIQNGTPLIDDNTIKKLIISSLFSVTGRRSEGNWQHPDYNSALQNSQTKCPQNPAARSCLD